MSYISNAATQDNTNPDGNDQLLDLFFICNIPSENKFQLFCRFITLQEDVYMNEYFDEHLADNYPIPWSFNMDEFYDYTHYKYRRIEGSVIVDGYKFGTFDSYEEAVNAAKSYSAKDLLDRFFDIYKEAKKYAEKEDAEMNAFNSAYKLPE